MPDVGSARRAGSPKVFSLSMTLLVLVIFGVRAGVKPRLTLCQPNIKMHIFREILRGDLCTLNPFTAARMTPRYFRIVCP